MLKGKELEEFIIISALGEIYTEHRDLDTYQELCDGVLSEDDLLWEPFEYETEADSVLSLVEDKIDCLKNFLKNVLES
jgi:hypothetical protein